LLLLSPIIGFSVTLGIDSFNFFFVKSSDPANIELFAIDTNGWEYLLFIIVSFSFYILGNLE